MEAVMNLIRFLFSFIVVALLSSAAVAQDRALNWERCEGSDPDLSINGCTLVLQSGQEAEANLAIAFFNRAIAYANKQDYDRAIEDYGEAIRLNPNNAGAFNNRGFAYANKQDYDRAIEDYGQAIQLNPNNSGAFFNRGRAYANKQDYDRAIEDYGQATRLNLDYSFLR
jgi:tetratricopeptide (TPR) repeat protein